MNVMKMKIPNYCLITWLRGQENLTIYFAFLLLYPSLV
uniref:Uncharacterized protein n=1 Tax=Rhizophora mucronata TaxID=61149 RepID=A0A2P2R1V8_RHIMU